MKKKESDLIIEALLFANAAPINQTKLNQVFDSPVPSLNNAIKRLMTFISKMKGHIILIALLVDIN